MSSNVLFVQCESMVFDLFLDDDSDSDKNIKYVHILYMYERVECICVRPHTHN